MQQEDEDGLDEPYGVADQDDGHERRRVDERGEDDQEVDQHGIHLEDDRVHDHRFPEPDERDHEREPQEAEEEVEEQEVGPQVVHVEPRDEEGRRNVQREVRPRIQHLADLRGRVQADGRSTRRACRSRRRARTRSRRVSPSLARQSPYSRGRKTSRGRQRVRDREVFPDG